MAESMISRDRLIFSDTINVTVPASTPVGAHAFAYVSPSAPTGYIAIGIIGDSPTSRIAVIGHGGSDVLIYVLQTLSKDFTVSFRILYERI